MQGKEGKVWRGEMLNCRVRWAKEQVDRAAEEQAEGELASEVEHCREKK